MMHPECRSCGKCKHATTKRSKNLEYIRYTKGTKTNLNNKSNRLFLILSGSFIITKNAKEYLCKTNEMAIIMANKHYNTTFVEDTEVMALSYDTISHVCENDSEEIKSILHNIKYEFCTLEMVPEVIDFSKSLKHYLEDSIKCYYISVSKHIEAFVLFKHYYSIHDVCRFFYPSIHKETSFFNIVMANNTNVNTASELAEACGYKSSNFRRLFKIHFGESPYQWMLKQKAPLIKEQLLNSNIPIKKIVIDFGFADQSHLNSFCKRFFNMTPLEVRKSLRSA